MGAVDASMERHAPRVTNPLMPNDQNLIEGMKLYTMNCALCHGGLDRKPSTLGEFVLPATAKPRLRSARRSRVAHLLHHPYRRPLHRHARLGQNSDEHDMWKITMFLSHMDKLPPAVQEYWKTSFGTGPEPEKKEANERLQTTITT